MLNDLRHACRLLVRQPGFTAVACLTLALGIGANGAIFSVLDAALFRPLPYRDADRLVGVLSQARVRSGGLTLVETPGSRAARLREMPQIFEDAGTFTYPRPAPLADPSARPLQLGGVPPDFARFLGVSPQRGRHFTADDVARDDAVLISDDYWTRAFGSDPNAIGQTIAFADRARVIVGVMPPTFRYFVGATTDAWTAIDERAGQSVVARLRAGLPLDTARRELNAALANPALGWKTYGMELHPAEWNRSQRTARAMLLALLGATGLLLLVACANVANLLLARTISRRRETAVRQALGASRVQLLRQFLAEGFVLAGLGGLAAMFVAWAGARILPQLVPRELAYTILGVSPPQFDGRVIAVGIALTLLTGLLCALVPAIRAARAPSSGGAFAAGQRVVGVSRDQKRLAQVFQAVQVAMTMVLLVGAGVLLAAFVRMATRPTGFDAENLAYLTLEPQGTRTFVPDRQVMDALAARLQAMPFISEATVGTSPGSGGISGRFLPEGTAGADDHDAGAGPVVERFWVQPDYFRVTGVRLRAGRLFRPEDADVKPPVAVIDEDVARRFWSGADAVGQRFRLFADGELHTVIGVVAHTRTLQMARDSATVFVPLRSVDSTSNVTFRIVGDPAAALGAVAADVRRAAPGHALRRIGVVDDLFAEFDPLGPSRFYSLLAGMVAVLGLVTAAVGLYGMLSFAVSRRTHEIGVRMALGASVGRVRGTVVADALVPVIAGMGAGLLLSTWLARYIAAQQPSVRANDPLAMAGVVLVFIAASVAAAIAPVRRATRVDALTALRAE